MVLKKYQALETHVAEDGSYVSSIVEKKVGELPDGQVLIKVYYSSLNYKDAMSSRGAKGITKHYPHTPGIDAAGVVEASNDSGWKVGDKVIVTGFDLGMNTDGGFGGYICVPSNWIVALPEALSLKESMIYGTAGFTAALSIDTLIRNGITPEKGAVAVSGATGGVGSLAVAMLSKLGYRVSAISSKASAARYLTSIGATEIIPREEIQEQTGGALLSTRFAGAVDSVGGKVLANIVKSLAYEGIATTCGFVNGVDIPVNIFPFIVKGVSLVGIDSVVYPIERRAAIWQKMATEWKPENLELTAEEISLEELPDRIKSILAGGMQGRAIVKLP